MVVYKITNPVTKKKRICNLLIIHLALINIKTVVPRIYYSITAQT